MTFTSEMAEGQVTLVSYFCSLLSSFSSFCGGHLNNLLLLLSFNSHSIKPTILKLTIQRHLVHSVLCTHHLCLNAEMFSSFQKRAPYHLYSCSSFLPPPRPSPVCILMGLVTKGGYNEGQKAPRLVEALQAPWTAQPFSLELGTWST